MRKVRVSEANDRSEGSCSESTTSQQTVPAKKLRRCRLPAAGFAFVPGATEADSLLLRRFEAGEFLDQHISVGALAPLEGPDAGAERRSHRVKLLAIRHVHDIGRRVCEVFRLVGLEHFIERRIENQVGDAGLRMPGAFGRILALAAHHYPNRVAASLGDLPLA